jgi:holo-[acyl-carrier protein] synthase
MISGIGSDIIRVDRIKRALSRTPGFETSIFSPAEIDYCRSKAFPEQHFAARYAAKEAFMKALGTGWAGGIRFQDIQIIRAENGKPSLEILEPTRNLIPECGKMKCWVTLSHERTVAFASVIIEIA